MSLAIVYSRANVGIDAPLVTVEIHLSNGLPGFSIVGLPETAVKESKERVRSALLNANFDFPDRRITVNMAPAELPKVGGRFDLAIAIGILAASGQVNKDRLEGVEFFGELALTGELRPVPGILPGVIACTGQGRSCVIARDNGGEAALVENAGIWLAGHLLDVCAWLQGGAALEKPQAAKHPEPEAEQDLNEVIGQHQARRALTIAAAGGHNLLLRGPPGTGKTMLASRMATILPALGNEEALEVAAIRSIARQSQDIRHWNRPPFRSPHHTSSAVALVGGGSTLNAGEISLAHCGVLFLDELPEFSPRVLEVMREPMESGSVMIARASYQVRLPARFQLIAAMNPCPCGYYGDGERHCRCSEDRVRKYQQRISGPLLDRIDLHVEVPRLNREERRQLLHKSDPCEHGSSHIRQQVRACRERQYQRAGKLNAVVGFQELLSASGLKKADARLLEDAASRLKLSTRASHRIVRIGRTIADLAGADQVRREHLLEALHFRQDW